MRYDLEHEVLRAAAQLKGAFGLLALRDQLGAMHARLAHPVLAHVVESLLVRLVDAGDLVATADGYELAERALRELQRAPSLLLVDDALQPRTGNDGGYALVERALWYVQGDQEPRSQRSRK